MNKRHRLTNTPRVVANYGAGVQSTALAYLHINKDPRLIDATGGRVPDLYIFADTGDEPAAVYATLNTTRADLLAVGVDLVVVSKGKSLAADLETRINSGAGGASVPPLFLDSGMLNPSPARRSCTADWKVAVIERHTKSVFGINPRLKAHRNAPAPLVDTWLGISTDEAHRMRTSGHKWQRFVYPLVEMRWSRGTCIKYLRDLGINAQRSSCVYCPFHSASAWKKVKSNPVDWARVVTFEKMLHKAHSEGKTVAGLRGKPYLHRSLVDIDRIDFDQQLELSLWGNECAGVCGV